MKKLALCILALVALALVSAPLALTSCDARANEPDSGAFTFGTNDAAAKNLIQTTYGVTLQ